MIYDEDVVKSVVEIYHKNSEIYKALMSGEKISKLVKKSFSKKGFGVTRIREKKQLFEKCKKCETLAESCDNNVVV